MLLSIDTAIEKVLAFLESIPLAPATVHYYSCCCVHVRDYCQYNGLERFTYQDAARFTQEQMNRADKKEFCKTYALIMRKAAYYVADCFGSGELLWKRNRYGQITLAGCYQQLLDSFEDSLSSCLADGSVSLIISEVRRLLVYLESLGCLEINGLNADHIRKYVIQEAPKHTGNYVNFTWPLKKFLAYLEGLGVSVPVNAGILLANPAPPHEKVLPAFDSDETAAILESIDADTKQGETGLCHCYACP